MMGAATAAHNLVSAWPSLAIVAAIIGVGWRARAWTDKAIAQPQREESAARLKSDEHLNERLDALEAHVAECVHLIEYHNGPNSGAPRMVERVVELTKRVRHLERRRTLVGAVIEHYTGVVAHDE